MDFVLEDGLVFVGSKLVPKSILVKDGKIAEIGQDLFSPKKIDCKSQIILPGLIDAHVHFRIPGAGQKEDWKTGSMAALAGGVTTVLDMPNNNPSCTTQVNLDQKEKIAGSDSQCNFGMHFGAANDNLEDLKTVQGAASFKVFLGSSTGNLLVTSEPVLKKIFSIAKKRNIVEKGDGITQGFIQRFALAKPRQKALKKHLHYRKKLETNCISAT